MRDLIRELSKVISEYEILVEENCPKKIEKLTTVLFFSRDTVRAEMMKTHKDDKIEKLKEMLVQSVNDIMKEDIFQNEFSFIANRF